MSNRLKALVAFLNTPQMYALAVGAASLRIAFVVSFLYFFSPQLLYWYGVTGKLFMYLSLIMNSVLLVFFFLAFIFSATPRMQRARLIVRILRQFADQRADYLHRIQTLPTADRIAVARLRWQYRFDCCNLALSSFFDASRLLALYLSHALREGDSTDRTQL